MKQVSFKEYLFHDECETVYNKKILIIRIYK